MSAEVVLVSRERGVLRVSINRPEKRNPVSRPVLGLLRRAFEDAYDDEDLRLAVLTGAGEKSFAAGGDLRELQSIRTGPDADAFSDEAFGALDAIRRFPLPVVAAINGDALGGGAELGIACDIRLMATHARIGFIQGRLNISTSWGGGTDLMRVVGYGRGLALLSRSAILSGQEAVAVGLVEAVAPEGTTFPDFVESFIEPIRAQTPLVLRAFKAQAMAERFGRPREEARRLEREHFTRTWTHDDHWSAADRVLAPARR